MNHKGTVKLETERLILRRFTENDIADIYENCWKNYNVWKWTSYESMDNIDDIKTKCGIFTDRWFMAYDKADRYTWAIVEKQSSKVIGRITGMNCDERTEQIELAYEIGENWWNLGYMTEAVKKIIEFFIEEVGFSRIYCSHAPDNPPSGKVMEKCGMKYEGTLRQAGKCNIGIYDELMYSVLKKDYHV